MIESLTIEQQQLLPRFRDEWWRWGTCTDHADRAKSETAILAMRAEIGVTRRPVFLWCESPATSLMALRVIKSPQWSTFLKDNFGDPTPGRDLMDSLRGGLRASLGESLKDLLSASLWEALRASLGESLNDSLRASLKGSPGASLRDSLWISLVASLRTSLGESLGESLEDSLEASLEDSLGDSLGALLSASLWGSLMVSLGTSLGASLGESPSASLRGSDLTKDLGYEWWGQHDSYWIAFYLFCRDIVGVKYDKKRSRQLDMWRDIAQSCCWWWPYDNYVIISERPTSVRMDNRRVLHCENGPALAFADGWQVHAWRGIRVPAEWIETKDKLDPKTALTWQNIEQRHAAANILGWDKVLASVASRTVDKNRDPMIGTLIEADLPDAPNSKFLKVRCATGRDFVLAVPAEMKTAREANAWTWRLKPNELKLEVRT